MSNKTYDVAIIGGGPAGFTAAIYAARAGREVVVIEKSAPGGKLINISTLRNWPGTESIKGGDLAINLFSQATALGAKYEGAEVIDLKKKKDIFTIYLKNGKEINSKSTIVATGLVSRKLGVPGEDKYYMKGLSYCVVCDGPLVKGKDIALIGGGNSSVQESLYGASVANKLYILQNLNKLTAEKIIIDTVKKQKNIEILYGVKVTEILGDGNKLNGLKYFDNKGNEKVLSVAGVFPYIGFIPNTTFLKNFKILDKYGFVKVNDKMETSVDGLYSTGDVNIKDVRQLTTAVNDGTIAAINANRFLSK